MEPTCHCLGRLGYPSHVKFRVEFGDSIDLIVLLLLGLSSDIDVPNFHNPMNLDLEVMIFRKHALMVVLAVFACQSFAADDSKDSQEKLRETIAYLTQRVAEADVIFVRNSKEYTPAEAAKHITRKYEHFKEKVRSPEDFIRLTATKSVVSGKPYLVKMKDGRTIPCSEWLHGILREYRAPQN